MMMQSVRRGPQTGAMTAAADDIQNLLQSTTP